MSHDLIVVICGMLMVGLYAGMETGCYVVNRVRLRYRSERGDDIAARLERNVSDTQRFIFTSLVVQNFFLYIVSSKVTEMFLDGGVTANMVFLWDFFPWSAEVAATLTLTLPLFIFSEIGPKNLFLKRADSLMPCLVWVQRVSLRLLAPITVPLKKISEALTPSREDYARDLLDINVQRLKYFFHESHLVGVINPHQNNMINNAIALQTAPVTELMVAPERAAILPIDATPEDCLELFRQNDNNYIPLFDVLPERIVGLVSFLDVVHALESAAPFIGAYRRPILRLPVSINLQQAFYLTREKRQDVAVIVDPADQVVGVLRVKDIVRRLVGN